MVATLCAVPTAAFAAETSDTENTVVSEQQTEAKTTFKFEKFFRGIKFDGENKPTLPEGLEKPDMSKLKKKALRISKVLITVSKMVIREPPTESKPPVAAVEPTEKEKETPRLRARLSHRASNNKTKG